MNGFKNIYGENDIKKAKTALRNGLLCFCAAALLFAAFCAVFVALYVKCGLNVYLCFSLNFVATAAFAWFTALYFKCVFARDRNLLAFYGTFENADLKPIRGEFVREDGKITEKCVDFTRLVFKTFDGETEIFVRNGTVVSFKEGKTYDLLAAGNRLWAYGEAEDV